MKKWRHEIPMHQLPSHLFEIDPGAGMPLSNRGDPRRPGHALPDRWHCLPEPRMPVLRRHRVDVEARPADPESEATTVIPLIYTDEELHRFRAAVEARPIDLAEMQRIEAGAAPIVGGRPGHDVESLMMGHPNQSNEEPADAS
jgi:hypothetical protein